MIRIVSHFLRKVLISFNAMSPKTFFPQLTFQASRIFEYTKFHDLMLPQGIRYLWGWRWRFAPRYWHSRAEHFRDHQIFHCHSIPSVHLPSPIPPQIFSSAPISKHLKGQLDPPVGDVTFFGSKEVSWIPLLVEKTTKLYPGPTIQSRPYQS